MQGTVAVTDMGWYEFLLASGPHDEVNFWKPSVRRSFIAPDFSPFLFKLKAPRNVICGFGLFSGYFQLPIWLAWDSFGVRNGCPSLVEMRKRLSSIRQRIGFEDYPDSHKIGCITVSNPVFFQRHEWVEQPADWPDRTVGDKKYDLTIGEGARVWRECEERARSRYLYPGGFPGVAESSVRRARPTTIVPRLGQGTFRIAVSEAYDWGCAATDEHSLPALEAAHIKPVSADGPNSVTNGILLRADLHRLFDKGYLTIDTEQRLLVSNRLKHDFNNGKSYYPYHGKRLRDPHLSAMRPRVDHLQWHNEHVFLE